MFVDRIIQHLKNAVMQPAFVRVADVHAGALSDRFQALELVNFGGIVLIGSFAHKRFGSLQHLTRRNSEHNAKNSVESKPEIYTFSPHNTNRIALRFTG